MRDPFHSVQTRENAAHSPRSSECSRNPAPSQASQSPPSLLQALKRGSSRPSNACWDARSQVRNEGVLQLKQSKNVALKAATRLQIPSRCVRASLRPPLGNRFSTCGPNTGGILGGALRPLLPDAAPEHKQGDEQLSRSAAAGVKHHVGYSGSTPRHKRLMKL